MIYSDARWTLVRRSPVPVHFRSEGLDVLIYTKGKRVEMVWVQESPTCCWVVLGKDGQSFGYEMTTAERGDRSSSVVTGVGETIPLCRPSRRWMFGRMRAAISTRDEALPKWAKTIWDEALFLVRRSVPPIALGDLKVDQGTELVLTLARNEKGILAADTLLSMNRFPTMTLFITTSADKDALANLVAYGRWTTDTADITVVVRVTEDFTEQIAADFMESVYPGLSSMCLKAKK